MARHGYLYRPRSWEESPAGRVARRIPLALTLLFVLAAVSVSSGLVAYTAWRGDLANGTFAILFALSDKIEANVAACYFAIFLANVGFYPINPGCNAWTLSNLAGPTKRAQGIGYMICLGNIGGIIGSYIYIEDEKPTYPTGFGTSFAFAGLGIAACFGLELIFWKINKNREAMTEEEIRAKYSEEELEKMGDRSPLFRYSY